MGHDLFEPTETETGARVFADYRRRKSDNTLKRHQAELANFARHLGTGADLGRDPEAWRGLTWGRVETFAQQMIRDGYAVGTVNLHLATIKVYAKLAAQAGALAASDLATIRAVSGYPRKEGRRIDEKRTAAGIPTRRGHKKSGFVVLSAAQEAQLRAGVTDKTGAVLLLLLLDLGLRVSEATAIRVKNFTPATGALQVYRKKTDSTTTFILREERLAVLVDYARNQPPDTPLLPWGERTIWTRVHAWGESLGLNLSPHDMRHTCATRLAGKLNVRQLMDFFGWNSPEMAARYIESVNVIEV